MSELIKEDIISFVEHSKSKALKYLRDTKASKVTETTEKLIFDEEVYGRIHYIQENINTTAQLIKELDEHIDKLGDKATRKEYCYRGLSYAIRELENFQDIATLYAESCEIPEVEKVKEEFDNQIRQTHEAYNLLLDKLRRMRNVNNMLELLKNNGFNISSIEPKVTDGILSPEILFPCKEQEN